MLKIQQAKVESSASNESLMAVLESKLDTAI